MKEIYVEDKSGTFKRLTWKNVMNSSNFQSGRHISAFVSLVDQAGYTFFTWNGCIYKSLGNLQAQDTKLTIEDLED